MALPDGYSVAKIHMKHFEMELLSPENTGSRFVVLQLHGGGYIGKMRNVYRNFAKEYCEMRGGIKTLSIDYRVAPKILFRRLLMMLWQHINGCSLRGMRAEI